MHGHIRVYNLQVACSYHNQVQGIACIPLASMYTVSETSKVPVVDLHLCVFSYGKTHTDSVIGALFSQNHYIIITGYFIKVIL